MRRPLPFLAAFPTILAAGPAQRLRSVIPGRFVGGCTDMAATSGIDALLSGFLRAAAQLRIPSDSTDVFRRLIVERVRDFDPDAADRLESMSRAEFARLADAARVIQDNS